MDSSSALPMGMLSSQQVRKLSSLVQRDSRKKLATATSRALGRLLSSLGGRLNSYGLSTMQQEIGTTSDGRVVALAARKQAEPSRAAEGAEGEDPPDRVESDLDRSMRTHPSGRGVRERGAPVSEFGKQDRVSKLHLRLVTNAETPTIGERKKCAGKLHIYDAPDGIPLEGGGFELICDRYIRHDGPCRDVTDIEFVPHVPADVPRIGSEDDQPPGSAQVVDWHDFTASDIRDLAELLT